MDILVVGEAGNYLSTMSNLIMSDRPPDFEQVAYQCADQAVKAAISLLNRGAALEGLVAVLGYADELVSVTVGPAADLLAKAPELAVLFVISCCDAEPGCLPWVGLFGPHVAWGAFRVVGTTVGQA